jgi:hypothetical protein
MSCKTLYNLPIKKVTFCENVKNIDGTSTNVMIYSKLFLGFFGMKNNKFKMVKTIEDVLDISDNIDILEFCIQKSLDLIQNLYNKEQNYDIEDSKIDKSEYNLSDASQIHNGEFFSKVVYPNGKIEYLKNKYPLYYDNDTKNIEIDWGHNFFQTKAEKYKKNKNKNIAIVITGSRDITQTVSAKNIPSIKKFIKLLIDTKEFIFLSLFDP